MIGVGVAVTFALTDSHSGTFSVEYTTNLGPPVSTNSQVQFQLTGAPAANYAIEATTNLAVPFWVSIRTNAAPFLFVETNLIDFPQRFCRALALP